MCDSCTTQTLARERDFWELPIGTRFPLVGSETIYAKTGDDRIDAVDGPNLARWEGRSIRVIGTFEVHPIS